MNNPYRETLFLPILSPQANLICKQRLQTMHKEPGPLNNFRFPVKFYHNLASLPFCSLSVSVLETKKAYFVLDF